MMGTSDTEVYHPLAEMLAAVHSLITKDETGEVQRSQEAHIPPAGLHLAIVIAVVSSDNRTITVMTIHVLGVTLGAGTQELHLERDCGSEPLSDTKAPVRREGTFERAVLGVVTAESVHSASSVDEPVLAK